MDTGTDGGRFDAIAKATATASRRSALRLLAAEALGALLGLPARRAAADHKPLGDHCACPDPATPCRGHCAAGLHCKNGRCRSAPPTRNCGGQCVDTRIDASNCGGCGRACSANHMATVTCRRGVCNSECAAEFADCNADKRTDGCETRILSDRANCGGCGPAFACAHGEVCCNGACKNLATDASTCGTCGHECAEGQICADRTCVLVVEQVFDTPGAHSFTAPAAGRVTIEALGAGGGAGGSGQGYAFYGGGPGGAGGPGGRVGGAAFAVAAGDVLQISVGGAGDDGTAGSNSQPPLGRTGGVADGADGGMGERFCNVGGGGGGGGGSSSVRHGSVQKVLAGGGGGGGGGGAARRDSCGGAGGRGGGAGVSGGAGAAGPRSSGVGLGPGHAGGEGGDGTGTGPEGVQVVPGGGAAAGAAGRVTVTFTSA